MTLKQFLQVAGGVVVGLLIYATGLPAIIKWPLIIISVAIGAALAFLPFEERPLEQWVIAFFRSIYSPTLYYWKRGSQPELFQPETAGAIAGVTSIPVPGILGKFEETEKIFLSKISGLFGGSTPLTTTSVPFPTPTPAPATQRPQVIVPKVGTPIITRGEFRPNLVVEEKNAQGMAVPAFIPKIDVVPVKQTLTPSINDQTVAPQFSPDAAPPSMATIPNTITGQVMDMEGKIVEGAILEIRDSMGRPVRAIRTNKAGHFITATPLANAEYELSVEKDGLIFDSFKFTASGAIISPFAVRAKGKNEVAAA